MSCGYLRRSMTRKSPWLWNQDGFSKVQLRVVLIQWPFQEPKLEVPTIYDAYCSGLWKWIYLQFLWPNICMVIANVATHFRILEISHWSTGGITLWLCQKFAIENSVNINVPWRCSMKHGGFLMEFGWILSGWWFGTWLLFCHILGMSSSQLTNSYFSEG